jgi:hypothetical protein
LYWHPQFRLEHGRGSISDSRENRPYATERLTNSWRYNISTLLDHRLNVVGSSISSSRISYHIIYVGECTTGVFAGTNMFNSTTIKLVDFTIEDHIGTLGVANVRG